MRDARLPYRQSAIDLWCAQRMLRARRPGSAKSAKKARSRRPTRQGGLMKIGIITLAAAAVFATSSAFAFHCPSDMKKIDDAMAKDPKLTPEQTADVKKYRAEGEALHKAGK